MAFTLGAMGSAKTNFYNQAYQRAGYADVAQEVQGLWVSGKREEAIRAVPDDLVLQANLIGTEDMVKEERIYSPFVGRAYPDRVLFGDTHFHTNLSFDAGMIGTRLTAHEGFRFARGEEVISNTGQDR